MTWNELLAIYDQTVDQCPRFERKGKTVPYTSANGHMFSFINKEGALGMRFSEEKQAQYIKQFDTGEFHSHGAVMRGYIKIPETLLKKEALLVNLLDESFDYVMSLPAK